MKPSSTFWLFKCLLRMLFLLRKNILKRTSKRCELTSLDRWNRKKRHWCNCFLLLAFRENLFFKSLVINYRWLKAGVCIWGRMKLLSIRGCLFALWSSPLYKKKNITPYGREEEFCPIHIDNRQKIWTF